MATIPLRQLSSRLEKIGDEIEEGATRLTKEIVIGIVNRVAELTPVDTGQARSNWQVGLGAPVSGFRKPFSPIPSRWRRPYPAGGSRSERRNLLGVTSAATGVMGRYKAGDSVYITNNLPYIGRLNQGYSRQSPAGFIRVGISAGLRLGIKNARFKL